MKQVNWQQMLKVADIVYYCHSEFSDPEELIARHQPTLGFIPFLTDRVHYMVVRHLNFEGEITKQTVSYKFFKRRNAAWQLPLKTHRFIKKFDPDIVLIHGFVFPLQLIALKMVLGKKCRIIVQHHAEQPASSIRLLFQRMADRYTDIYMFTAKPIAMPWLKRGVIRNGMKIQEVPGASAAVEKKDRTACKKELQFSGNSNFLWVGRLNQNKDPITVLQAFALYVPINRTAVLHLVYQTEELLDEIKSILAANPHLANAVRLIGKRTASELADWFNAADYFISASRSEAAGYALQEAVSAGCIPVVSRIPSYETILKNGSVGHLFEAGDAMDLAETLCSLPPADAVAAQTIVDYHTKNLGNKMIADGLFNLFVRLKCVQ